MKADYFVEALHAALRSGDIGFAEAFIDGHWSSPDIVALLQLMLANRDPAVRLTGRVRVAVDVQLPSAQLEAPVRDVEPRYELLTYVMAQRALDMATAHVTKRSTFGKKLDERRRELGVEDAVLECDRGGLVEDVVAAGE